MIQRVQTLFLLVITILSALLIFLPFQSVTLPDAGHAKLPEVLLSLNPAGIPAGTKAFIYVPIALNLIILIFSLITIFMYGNRKKQMKFTQLLLLFSALLIGNLFVMHFFKGDETTMQTDYKIASFFPAINAICAFLAMRFIKKDEELVRSADRIR